MVCKRDSEKLDVLILFQQLGLPGIEFVNLEVLEVGLSPSLRGLELANAAEIAEKVADRTSLGYNETLLGNQHSYEIVQEQAKKHALGIEAFRFRANFDDLPEQCFSPSVLCLLIARSSCRSGKQLVIKFAALDR